MKNDKGLLRKERAYVLFLNGLVSVVMLSVSFAVALSGCEELDDDLSVHEVELAALPLDDVAVLLSEIPLGIDQIREVHDAVSASSVNGYDEEYMMRHLFTEPGAGVGDDRIPAEVRKSRLHARAARNGSAGYALPLKDMIREHLAGGGVSAVKMKSGTAMDAADILGDMTVEEYLEALQSSDIQIYWPYADMWDGETYPVITFDPMDGGSVNDGYSVERNAAGELVLEKILVNEGIAQERPVWVVNRNDDSGYTSLELLRMADPDWGSGGGDIIVSPNRSGMQHAGMPKVSGQTLPSTQMLVLKDFTMKRHFDSWFAGASEFFVKIGSVESFTASTEAELLLYTPSITDFMIVVRRKNLGKPQPFNAVLVSEWTEQLTHCAFMVVEDDGGKRDSWKCSAVVKYNSKSYGFEMSIPINTRDDIVWRGQLSRKYIIANDGLPSHFGDVDITFEIIDL